MTSPTTTHQLYKVGKNMTKKINEEKKKGKKTKMAFILFNKWHLSYPLAAYAASPGLGSASMPLLASFAAEHLDIVGELYVRFGQYYSYYASRWEWELRRRNKPPRYGIRKVEILNNPPQRRLVGLRALIRIQNLHFIAQHSEGCWLDDVVVRQCRRDLLHASPQPGQGIVGQSDAQELTRRADYLPVLTSDAWGVGCCSG